MDPIAHQDAVADAIRRVQAGETDAFTVVVRAYQRPLRAWASRWCVPGIEADEIAHQSFIIAFRIVHTFTAGGNCFAWLCAIARNVLRDETKRLRNAPSRSALLVVELDAATQEIEDDYDDGRLQALRDCLKRLPSEGADLVHRYYAGREPIATCAERLGKTPGAVKSHLHWLRGKLHDCMAAKLGEAGP